MSSKIKSHQGWDEEPESLADLLTVASVSSKFDKTPHPFVPESFVASLITTRSVQDALFDDGYELDEEDETLISYILRDARRLFAITVLTRFKRTSNTLRAMWLFQEGAFSDKDLPFEDLPSTEPHQAGQNGDTQSVDMSTNRLGALGRPWQRAQIRTFCTEQWKLLAPVFDTDKENHDFRIHTIPFIATGDAASEGSFGFVRKYTIHSDHVRGTLKNNLKDALHVVAVKEIKKEGKNEKEKDPHKVASHWASEAKALAKMNTLNQDHIVRFITAFRRCLSNYEEHYLVFEWADGGNLHDLWKSLPRPKLEPALIKAAVRQLSGLAAALKAAHNLDATGASYRHGDLEPANILWFHDGSPLGKLKIGDWGEAKSHNLLTELRPVNTTAEYGTRRYEPPEVVTGLYPNYLGQPARRRSRLYDVWAMGCITLEFIVWLLYGVKELEKFNRSIQEKDNNYSPFYKIVQRDQQKVAEVHHKVVHWMEVMAKDAACETEHGVKSALGDLLHVVGDQLLVVELPQRSGLFPGRNVSGPIPTADLQRLSTPRRHDGLNIQLVQEPLEMDTLSGADVPAIAVTPAANDSNAARAQIAATERSGTTGQTRATASILCRSLDSIARKEGDEAYWTVDIGQRRVIETPDAPPVQSSTEDTTSGADLSSGTSFPALSVPTRNKVSHRRVVA